MSDLQGSNTELPSRPRPPPSGSLSLSSWNQFRSVMLIVSSSSPASSCTSTLSDRVHLKSPWSQKRRKHTLLPQKWKSFFTSDGKLRDGGAKFLKRVRSGGVDPSIKAEVWPFLLGVYDLSSSEGERDAIRIENRKEYDKLRKQCQRLLKHSDPSLRPDSNSDGGNFIQYMGTPDSEHTDSARESLSGYEKIADFEYSDNPFSASLERNMSDNESSVLDSFEDPEMSLPFSFPTSKEEYDPELPSEDDFSTWQRIIRVDAVRINPEWTAGSLSQVAVSDRRAHLSAEAVGLKHFDHLEPYQIFHASRLVTILEAYAVYDPEIGYCQGMSDLLSPLIAVLPDDHEAFWCFVGFMRKARHNFRLDEAGIRRQLNIVSKIIKCKDSHLYRHLEKLEAEDCFFVYRMVVVLLRRELSYEQTICLWEVMWADQAAIRAGIGKSIWSRIQQRAPPTEDLLLYAVAASVLQRRKRIIEKYCSMDEIIRECNGMGGQLDVWKLLADAHDLVVTLHDKIETSS